MSYIGERVGYTPADTKDAGSAILKIALDTVLNNVNAPFLGKVVAVKGNKVDIQPLDLLEFQGVAQPPTTYFNLLVGQMNTGKAYINNPIQIGDVGLCVVLDKDISNYKENGGGGIPPSYRRFNKMDSVFIPLSMYNQKDFTQDFIFNYLGSPNKETLNLKISGQQSVNIQGGENYTIEIDDNGNLTVDTKGNIIVKSAKEITTEATNKLLLKQGNNNIEISDSNITIKNSAKVAINAPQIEIGDGATEPLILGTMYQQLFTNLLTALSTHTHTSSAPGAPTSPSADLAPACVSAIQNLPNTLSKTNKTK